MSVNENIDTNIIVTGSIKMEIINLRFKQDSTSEMWVIVKDTNGLVRSGHLSASLRNKGRIVREESSHPVTPGFYKIIITPVHFGTTEVLLEFNDKEISQRVSIGTVEVRK